MLKLTKPQLSEIRAAALRTLTAIIHLDLPKLYTIIDVTGATSNEGFLSVLVRTCMESFTGRHAEPFPMPLSKALFGFLFKLASYKAGQEALVDSSMMKLLLQIVSWPGSEFKHQREVASVRLASVG